MVLTPVLIVIFTAIIGWLATIISIKNARINERSKQALLIISWMPWICIALGAPVISGYMALGDAINIAGAMTIGIGVSILMARRRQAE